MSEHNFKINDLVAYSNKRVSEVYCWIIAIHENNGDTRVDLKEYTNGYNIMNCPVSNIRHTSFEEIESKSKTTE